MTDLTRLDRRLFLRGLMLTSVGLIVPKPKMIQVPPAIELPRVARLVVTGATAILRIDGIEISPWIYCDWALAT